SLKGDIEPHFVPTDLQLADIFTKPLVEPSFTRLVFELEADAATKTIIFTLSCFDKPLSFNLDVFSTVIELKPSENCVSVPPKETVKAGLATLGLFDKKHPNLSPTNLINSSPVKINLHPKTGKPERKENISYTRFLCLIMEHLLKDTYKNDDLKSLKPHNTTTTTFKPTFKNEVPLTAHIYKVDELSPDPHQVFAPSLWGVLDHTINEKVKDAGIKSIRDLIFEQVMDEYDQKNSTAEEQPECPYDTESKIKFIKSFKVATISGSLSIDLDKG
ncbi:hypothetical protein Tco_1270629, partial [Tanacetum coccineum]